MNIVNAATCAPLNLENGSISYNTSPLANGEYQVDTVAIFTCISTYNLFGSGGASTCQANTTWNQANPLCVDSGNEIKTIFILY